MRADPYITSYSQTYSEFGLQQSKLWPANTLCITIAGANTAKTAILKFEACFPDSVVGFIAHEEKADLHFVKYSLDLMKDRFRAVTRGATQDNLSLDKLLGFPIATPTLPVQRRIACILSAYDELIENNLRRIRILEEMARALYREWFVNFRFPGHESGRRTFNRPNPMPEGWEGRFSELANLERIGINPSEFPDEEFEHFSIPAFDDERRPVVERGETILSSKYRVGTSCVLLSKLNPRIRRVWLPEPSGQRAAIASTEFLVLNPRPGISREFIYAHCCSEEFAEGFNSLAIGTSTSHQRVKPDDLLAMSTIVPDPRTIEFFTCFVRPVFALQQRLRVASTNLRRTRDLLLPRLLSGQVSLDVDEEVPQESGVERREQDEIGLA